MSCRQSQSKRFILVNSIDEISYAQHILFFRKKCFPYSLLPSLKIPLWCSCLSFFPANFKISQLFYILVPIAWFIRGIIFRSSTAIKSITKGSYYFFPATAFLPKNVPAALLLFYYYYIFIYYYYIYYIYNLLLIIYIYIYIYLVTELFLRNYRHLLGVLCLLIVLIPVLLFPSFLPSFRGNFPPLFRWRCSLTQQHIKPCRWCHP